MWDFVYVGVAVFKMHCGRVKVFGGHGEWSSLSIFFQMTIYIRIREVHNQSPKGIIWSAVLLPCFFDVLKLQRVAGQRAL